jgi:hypothetical protein
VDARREHSVEAFEGPSEVARDSGEDALVLRLRARDEARCSECVEDARRIAGGRPFVCQDPESSGRLFARDLYPKMPGLGGVGGFFGGDAVRVEQRHDAVGATFVELRRDRYGAAAGGKSDEECDRPW